MSEYTSRGVRMIWWHRGVLLIWWHIAIVEARTRSPPPFPVYVRVRGVERRARTRTRHQTMWWIQEKKCRWACCQDGGGWSKGRQQGGGRSALTHVETKHLVEPQSRCGNETRRGNETLEIWVIFSVNTNISIHVWICLLYTSPSPRD